MFKGLMVALLAALACSIPTPVAHAGFVIGNLDGDDGADSRNLAGGRTQAMGFTMPAGSDYLLTDAILRLRIRGNGVVPTIQIWSNGGSDRPTTLLTTLANPPIPNASSLEGDFEFAQRSPFLLAGGSSYWLVASGTSNVGTPTYDWLASSPGVLPTGPARHLGSLFGTNGISSLTSSATLNSYAIEATIAPTAVPEPASVILVGLGLLGSIDYARRRAATLA